MEPPPEAPKEEKPVWPRIEELRHTLREQEVEYRALQRELYQADHTVRDRQAGNARLEESGQGRRRELQDLREVLYALLNGTEPEREAGKSAASDGFSRLLPRTVTVFGGKEAWRRKMKQLLPGVNCRKADGSLRLPEKGTIWIQPRGLTPRRYTALLDAIRQAGLPVRYFLSETAEQCAEELIAGEE